MSGAWSRSLKWHNTKGAVGGQEGGIKRAPLHPPSLFSEAGAAPCVPVPLPKRGSGGEVLLPRDPRSQGAP